MSSYYVTRSIIEEVKTLNDLYYSKGEYEMYYNKLNEMINTQFINYFMFLTPTDLQKMSWTDIEDDDFVVPFLGQFAKEIIYMPTLDESCYIDPETCDFGKVYSYFMSIPNTTDKLTKITLLSLRVRDFIRDEEMEYCEHLKEIDNGYYDHYDCY